MGLIGYHDSSELRPPERTPGCKKGKHEPDLTWSRSESGEYDYDVALSFAGEDRDYVKHVAWVLTELGARVFYDEYEASNLWGKDLVEHLDGIYRNRSRYCVLFISQHYAKKIWPKHERKSAQARALNSSSEYLLPARFDDTELPGLQPTISYIDLRKLASQDFAHLIIEKLGMRTEIDELINYLKSQLVNYEITVEGTELNFSSSDYDGNFPLRLMLEMYRADQIERMFLMPAIVPW